jgi:phosphatidate cytidylyltransferase
MLVPRLISFVVLWALLVACVIYRLQTPVFLLIAFFGLIGQWEFYSFQQSKGLKVFKKTGVTCGAVLFLCSYLSLTNPDPVRAALFTQLAQLTILIVIVGAVGRQVFSKVQATSVETIALTLLGFFYVPYLFNFVVELLFWNKAGGEGLFFALFLVLVTKMTDAGAYTTGSLFGRTKMIPSISPKKTWEGFAGGIVAAIVSGVVLVHLFPGQLSLLQGPHAWIAALILSLVSVVGDLGESLMKRDAHLKNSGSLVPGIGGVLDLIDSLLFTAPLFYFYLVLLSLLS